MTTYADYVKSAIEKLSASRKVVWDSSGNYAKIQCVNKAHKGGKEETPSLRINLTQGKYTLGSAHCFSCGVNYKSWNELTKALFRPDLAANPDEMEEPDRVSSFFNENLEKEINEDEEQEQETNVELIKDLRAGIPWNKQQPWRGIHGKMLSNLHSVLYFDSSLQIPMLYLPCKINKKEVGGVRAKIKPKKDDNFKYSNTPGSWVISKGLLCYDIAKRLMKNNNFSTIVVVEGPRDALNWCQNGIPTTGILGSNNFNETKAELLLALGIKRVITAFDNDEAGDRAKKLVYNHLRYEVEVVNFNLHKWAQKLNMRKLDPGNSPIEVMDAVKKHLV